MEWIQIVFRIFFYFRVGMKQAHTIANKVLLLLMDILVFTFQVVRKVILPNRRRKGNVLSSVLTFFVGLLERIVTFERSILRLPVVFTHKYVKQGLIIVVGFLFLLSSIEWTIAPSTDAAANGSQEVIACSRVAALVETVTPRRANFSVVVMSDEMAADRCILPFFSSRTGPPITGRRWLRFRVFRI